MSPLSKDYQEMSKRVGGAFRMTSLIQKRAKQLMSKRRGRLADTDNVVEIAISELERGRIRLRIDTKDRDEDSGS